MGKSSKNADAEICKKYGVPFYGASWVPPAAFRFAVEPPEENIGGESPVGENPPPIVSGGYLVLAGGGGEGRSGIPNALVISRFDFDSNSLSDQPVDKLGTGGDLPYRMAVHPGGEGVVCSLPKGCRWYEWTEAKSSGAASMSLKPSEKVLEQLEEVGQQLAISFSRDGSVLAVGGEDGKLRVFKWPSMETIIDEADCHTSVKDLDFSPDGKFLATVGSGSPGRVWDVMSSKPVASLPKENDEVFGFCRFSHASENHQFLYVTAMRDKGGSIVKWDTTSWTRISSKHIVRDPISAFDVSADGRLLAIGTIQGDIHILNSISTRMQMVVKRAHLGLVTTLMFSEDSRALVSASLDSSARVTLIVEENKNGMRLWVILFIILLAVALYYAQSTDILS